MPIFKPIPENEANITRCTNHLPLNLFIHVMVFWKAKSHKPPGKLYTNHSGKTETSIPALKLWTKVSPPKTETILYITVSTGRSSRYSSAAMSKGNITSKKIYFLLLTFAKLHIK